MIRKIRPRARVSPNLLKVTPRGTDPRGGFAPYPPHVNPAKPSGLSPYLINQTLAENGGGGRHVRAAPYTPLKFSVEGLRAYGCKINYQIYYTTKSLPNLTTFPTSNYFKNNTRYKLSVFSIYSMW